MPGGSILMTSAPKSDITVAAAGPAIKLAQSMTLSPSKMRSVTHRSLRIVHHRGTENTEISSSALCALCLCSELISHGEAVGVAVADDTAGGSAGEMRA